MMLRHALRTLWRNPGFSLVAILTLALGIGATTLIFSITDALIFHVFPYRDAGRLVVFRVHQLRPGGFDGAASPPIEAFRDLRANSQSFEGVEGYWNASLLYTSSEGAQRVDAAWVTPDTFTFLGVPPELGRGLAPQDDAVCVISHRFWQEKFGGDAKALGSVLNLNNTPRTVIGVMPPRFQYLGVNLWIPYGNGASAGAVRGTRSLAGGARFIQMMGRLKPGVSVQAATAEFDAFERRMVQAYPEDFPDPRFTVSVRTLVDDTVGNLKPVLFTLFAAVSLLLLIACSNVANLLLVRSTVRHREMAIRAAIGASRARLASQLLLESGILAVAAGIAGCLMAAGGLNVLASLIPQRFIPGEAAIAIHPAALWFALGVTLLTTLICGLAPALQVAGASLGVPLARTTQAGRGLRSALVIAEVALSIVLLIGAGLMTRTFLALTRVDLGFQPANLLHAEVSLPRGRYENPAELQAFFNELVARVRRLPGVTSAGVSFEVPPAQHGPLLQLEVVGRSGFEQVPTMLGVSSESHFQTMGRTIRRGASLSEADVAAARQVMVVNETFARTYFAGQDPLGQRIRLDLNRMIAAPSDPTFTIVGVVSDVRNQGLRKPVLPEAYVPYTMPLAMGTGAILVKTAIPPMSLVESIRKQVWALDANALLTHPGTMEQALTDSSYAEPRFGLISVGGFAALGLALVIAGVFSVMAYTVSIQTRDIGIRMALGARQRQILTMVLRKGLAWIGSGIAIGVCASLFLTRLLASQLWGVSATDPWTFAGVILLVTLAGSAACLAPARHAAQIDPLVALRHE
jgi:putative ABC transport system permease protein